MAHGFTREASPSQTRREFLAASATLATVATTAGNLTAMPTDARPKVAQLDRITKHLYVFRGATNIGVVRDGDQGLLIDCGDPNVARALASVGITQVTHVLVTHGHRDQVCAVPAVAPDAAISVSAEARDLLADPMAYWRNDQNLYRVYRSFRPDHLTPIEPIKVTRTLSEGDSVVVGSAIIRVLATPGHTDDGLSFVVEVDGKKIVFSGDTICADGKLWDVHSLQRGFQRGTRRIGGYHGFMGDQWRLADSVKKIDATGADMLVPAHSNLVRQPRKATATLLRRLQTCYANYVSISALRHYFPELFTEFAGRPGQMPIRPGIKPPDCLRHFGTTWMLVAKSGAALVMDAGSPNTVKQLKKMRDEGQIKRIDALWVTHYHHDHTGGIVAFQKEFDCPCIADRRLAEVLETPARWRLPCLIAEPVRVDQRLEDGTSWQWEEFKLTSFFYPGQTMYHDALLAESGDLHMLFVGDSHTMGGNDDYCAHNRNLLGPGVGYQYCLDLLERLKPTHLFNCHVADAFTFSQAEIDFMRKTLDQREKLFGDLVAWPHANYGTDPSWVHADPYLQTVAPGGVIRFDVCVANYARTPTRSAVRPVAPAAWHQESAEWKSAEIEPANEARLTVQMTIPANVAAGRHAVAIDVRLGDRMLRQYAEALVDVQPT